VGQGTIDWYGQAQESYFVKSTADTLAAAFITGTVRISSPPSITGLSDMTLCEGEELLTFAMVQAAIHHGAALALARRQHHPGRG